MRLVNNPLLLFVIGICAVLLLPALFMDGMFSDGIQYAAVSRNFSEHIGTFWQPYYTATHYSYFTEQPPLMFALQGSFFTVFGNSLYTERLYCLVAAVINGILLMRCWKLLTGKTETTWLPLLLWFTMPVIFYAFINNLEECTMSVFILLALQSILQALFSEKKNQWWWFIAGVYILASGLTKGIQGMFLLSAPFWAWMILRDGNARTFITRSALIFFVPALFAVIAWFTPVVHDSLQAYFVSRLGKTFNGQTAHGDTRFHLLYELLLDTLPAMGMVALFVLTRRKTTDYSEKLKTTQRKILFLLACGLSGILPLLVTREQRGFYLAAPLPIVALALGLSIAPIAEQLTARIAQLKKVRAAVFSFALLLIAGTFVITYLKAGEPKRDAEKIAAVHEIASITGDSTTLFTSTNIFDDWALVGYAERYHHLSFSDQRFFPLWILLEKGSPAPAHGRQIALKTPLFDLYSVIQR